MARDLGAFFAPRSVAVVGAGERPTSSGGAVLQNLRISGFAGEIIPVNPKGGTMFGFEVRRGLHELDAPADLVVIVIRPDRINAAVREAAASGHRNLLILPGGFAEAGAEGLARDAELRRIVAEHDLTIAGPNCAGIIHLPQGARFAATFLRDLPPGPRTEGPGAGGGIAFISQSGAIAEEVIATTNRMRLPVGTVVTIGNALQLGIADFLEHAGADPATMAVLLYIESLDDPARVHADGPPDRIRKDESVRYALDVRIENQADDLGVPIDHRTPGIPADDVVRGNEVVRRREIEIVLPRHPALRELERILVVERRRPLVESVERRLVRRNGAVARE